MARISGEEIDSWAKKNQIKLFCYGISRIPLK